MGNAITKHTLDPSQLAFSYRRLVLWFGVQLVVALVGPIVTLAVGESTLGLVVLMLRLIALLGTVVALAVYAYKTAEALGSSVGALWAVAMLIPCANVVTILVLSSRATAACRAAGIPVGFLGPKQVSVPQTHKESPG
jgi:hypothetical protein